MTWRIEWRPGLAEVVPVAGWCTCTTIEDAARQATSMIDRHPECRLRVVLYDDGTDPPVDVAAAHPSLATIAEWRKRAGILPEDCRSSGEFRFDRAIARRIGRMAAFRRIIRRMSADGMLDERTAAAVMSKARLGLTSRL